MIVFLSPIPEKEWEAWKASWNRKRPHLFSRSMKKLHDVTNKLLTGIFKDA